MIQSEIENLATAESAGIKNSRFGFAPDQAMKQHIFDWLD